MTLPVDKPPFKGLNELTGHLLQGFFSQRLISDLVEENPCLLNLGQIGNMLARVRNAILKRFVDDLKNVVQMNPKIMLYEDFSRYLRFLDLSPKEIDEFVFKINKCFNHMAKEKTGSELDEESLRFLRNELILAMLIAATKE